MKLIPLTDAQQATVLAALQHYYDGGMGDPAARPFSIHCIANCGDTVIPLDQEGVGDLIDQVENGVFGYSITGPDGFWLDQEPYFSIDEAIQAAARFPLRFVRQGHYTDARLRQIPPEKLPDYMRLELVPFAQDEEERTGIEQLPGEPEIRQVTREDMDADGWVSGVVEVEFRELHERDLEGFMDLLSEKLTGSDLLCEISYSVIGHRGDTLWLQVQGDAKAMIWPDGESQEEGQPC